MPGFLPRDENDNDDEDTVAETLFRPPRSPMESPYSTSMSSFPSELQDDDDEDDVQSEEDEYDLLDSPFLSTFQREIHSIVRDYRKEVTETFDQLMEDMLLQSSSSSLSREGDDDNEEEDGDDIKATVNDIIDYDDLDESEDDGRDDPSNRIYDGTRPIIKNDISYEKFVVGDTDEEEEDVLFRLGDDVATRDQTSSNRVEGFTNTLPTTADDELNEVLSEEEEDLSLEPSRINLTSPTEIESIPEPQTPKKKARKKHKSRKAKAKADTVLKHNFGSTGGDSRSRPRGGTSDDDQLETLEFTPKGVVNGSLSSSSLIQTIKSVFTAVSVLAVGILLSIAFQILKKMLWSNSQE
jgi:hypothetical protein